MSSEAAPEAAGAPRPGSEAWQRWRRYVPLVALALAVHVLLPQLTTLEESLGIVRRLRWWALLLAIAAQVLSYCGSGYLAQAIVAAFGQRLARGRAMAITLARSSIGLVAAGVVGSGASAYRWCRDAGISAEAALMVGWLPAVFNSAVLLAATVLGLVQLLTLHDLSRLEAVGFSLSLSVLIAVAGGLLWVMRHRSRSAAMAERVAARWARVRRRKYDPSRTRDEVARLFGALAAMRRGGWRRALLGSSVNIGFDLLTLFCLFVAARHVVTPGVLLAGYGMPLLLARVSFLPGGLGVTEGTMVGLYHTLGVPTAVAVPVVLAYRLLSFWMPTLVGFPLAGYLQHKRVRGVSGETAAGGDAGSRTAGR